ncbi:hypothetical protein M0804_013387 [Polistes exclamans]|nr:hypothetical protein M0804_013387 [Polistes exclamans]
MSKEDSFDIDNHIIWYLDQFSRLMQIYYSEKDDFNSWLNRFEYAADIISIPKYHMSRVFFKMVNNKVHERIQKFNPDINFSELPYKKIIDHYLRFFSPKEDYLHRGRFKCRKQYKEESIERYADRLRKIYNMCCYKSDLEEELCVQFINGIFDNDIRNKLSETPKLSFKKTVTKAIEFSKYNLMEYYVNQAHLEINNYNPKTGVPFHAWLNKFEYVADTIGVKEDKMITFFKRMVDTDFQASIKVFFGSKLYNMSYSEIIESYLHYFSPNEMDLHRARFNCRKQYKHETITKYADNLQKIYNKCYEMYKSDPEDELCAQFIKGINDNVIRTFLSKTSGLSFNETVEKAIKFSKSDTIKYFLDEAHITIKIYNP